ncbi:hypothetical protein Adu01nite_62060 [Paractinoplanes durhamensis]|uniref:Uncharacterized protein n=1 Tax=Paractinoplanes durhamensis TaxID=113563 RepID=A0ABQ3Z4X3_9ACTN|nr:hypothetical protein Adu01nite_62060 [Actinoplanes durhamensis]
MQQAVPVEDQKHRHANEGTRKPAGTITPLMAPAGVCVVPDSHGPAPAAGMPRRLFPPGVASGAPATGPAAERRRLRRAQRARKSQGGRMFTFTNSEVARRLRRCFREC